MVGHETHMRRALDLALHGQGGVEPNPLVGAVLVRGGRVAAEGWHDDYGGPHAEVDAIRRALGARDRAGGARRLTAFPASVTCYVTLEPCTHFGKTPPCAPFLVESGIRRVVVATRDPNPVNDGRGLAFLRRAGVHVTEGVLRREAEALNAPFFKLHRTGLPWVIAKWAMSADGKIAARAGASNWITGPAARAYARRLRARCQAVVVGIGTALADDPRLMWERVPARDARRPGAAGAGFGPANQKVGAWSPLPRRPYVRVVLDSLARLPLRSRLVKTARTARVLVAVSARAPGRRCRALERAGCEVFVGGRARPDLGRLLEEFGRRAYTHVLVEGGGAALGSAFDGAWVDEVYAFIAPCVIGGTSAIPAVGGAGARRIAARWAFRDMALTRIDRDIVLHGRRG